MTTAVNEAAPQYDAYPFDLRSIVQLLIVGAVTGAVGWLLYLAISQFFIEPVFCSSAETFSICQNGGTIAWISAHIIVMAALVAVLARLAVYRPLLVALAVLLSLWGTHVWLGGMDWYIGLAWQLVLFAVAVALFGWIARLTNFLVAVILSIAVVIISRVVLLVA